MKKILTICLSLMFTATLSAQTMPYPTDTIKGKVYYRYPVQKGEGLYRISKNFGVSQEDIVKINPELQHSGLKLGQTILIPAILTVDSSKYIVHELKPKETLYGISKLYGVKISQIQELNPETSQTMRIGERLLIPAKEGQENGKEKEKEEIKPNKKLPDNIKVIDKKDNENAQVAIEKPKADTIQHAKADTIQRIVAATFTNNDTVLAFDNDLLPDTITTDTIIADTLGNDLRIAVLLPFMTEAAVRDASVERFMEFYEGMLLAINNATDKQQHITILAYDTDKTEARILSILADSALLSADAIVGPAYPAQVSLVAQYAKQNRIPLIVPFTSKIADIEQNPYIIQFNPSEQVEAQKITEWIENRTDELNCIFFTDPTYSASSLDILKKEIHQRELPATEAPLQVLLADSADYLMSDSKTNLIILPSDKYSNMQTALQHLQRLNRQYSLCLLSQYAWQKENIPLKQVYTYLFNTERSISSESLLYGIQRKLFFPAELKNKAPRYDLLGYDITSWLLNILTQPKQLSLSEKISAVGDFTGLQSDLQLSPAAEEGGWMNQALMINCK